MSRFPAKGMLLILLAIAMNSGCDAVLDVAVNESEKISYKETDKQLDAALKGPNENGEILVPMTEFFGNPQKYKLWAGDPASFKSLGEKCVAAGATGAYAVVTQEDGVQVTDTFAIALPTEKPARAKVIETYNQFWKDAYKAPPAAENTTEDEKEEAEMIKEELESYLTKDLGQKYITFSYDD